MNGQIVYGRFLSCCPGVCYVLRCGPNTFRIINDFEYTIICPPYPKEPFNVEEEINYLAYQTFILTMKTLNFWFKSEVSTKIYLTLGEIYQGVLIHPMSDEGLSKEIRPSPILNYSLASLAEFNGNSLTQSDKANYFLETGEILQTRQLYSKSSTKQLTAEKIHEQEIAWHISRAIKHRIQNQHIVRIEGSRPPFLTYYVFDDFSNHIHIEYQTPIKNMIYSAILPYTTPPLYDDLPASPISTTQNSDCDLSVISESEEYPSQLDYDC